ncbi:type II toxin-antitoxin system RelE/ParE family toxin [bacterium]|jgi:mRNA interferase RelE/StbE|nr:type II toxin-antitoxin system RelE/ParE family toxin [Verrucomicrobiota bacterium]MDA7511211.1 type II toxin-antitoxin system RelE/ParE family toxin [Verrucomicrobiota bacterium]MDA7633503.1 type II toxin-antitoxin system RelE/ParE family toxin [bacterium]MDB4746078.1 type II toxin-antitoxin system RelE/ParE family toxin [Verrucomicrobiota bacterium]
MERYRLEFAKSVRKEFRKIGKRDASRILKVINSLETNPRPPSCKKLTDNELYRIRIGNFRVVYEIFDDRLVILIVKVSNRKDVYR